MTTPESKPRKIVFVNQATGYITIDIINALAGEVSELALIAGSIRVQDVPLNEDVGWSRINLYNRGNPRKKFFSWVRGTIQIFTLLLRKYRSFEIFYITIPPFAYLLSWFLPNKFSILIFDVYPDVLKIYNIGEKNPLYRIWQRLNRKIFNKAIQVYTISEGMAQLLSEYMPYVKIRIIPLWTGLKNATPIPKKENPWLSKLGLQDKFIVQYSGNIGYTHNVELIIEVASKMRSKTDCHFLIIGRGDKFEKIRNLITESSLSNCTLLPFQPDNILIYSLAAADIGVVMIEERVANVSLPSKIYNLQAVGVPILGISPPDSVLAQHLEKYGNGFCVKQNELEGIVKFINELQADESKLNELKFNSLSASKDFTASNANKYANDHLSKVF